MKGGPTSLRDPDSLALVVCDFCAMLTPPLPACQLCGSPIRQSDLPRLAEEARIIQLERARRSQEQAAHAEEGLRLDAETQRAAERPGIVPQVSRLEEATRKVAEARLKAEEARLKAEEARLKGEEARLEAVEARLKAQEATAPIPAVRDRLETASLDALLAMPPMSAPAIEAQLTAEGQPDTSREAFFASGQLATRSPDLRTGLLWTLAILTVLSAIIHFLVAPEHFSEDWRFGTFFVLIGVLQLAWAVAIVVRPSSRLYVIGAIGNLAVVAVWIASRTVGMPIGPTAWQPERIGVLDVASTVIEVLCAVGAWYLLSTDRGTAAPAFASADSESNEIPVAIPSSDGLAEESTPYLFVQVEPESQTVVLRTASAPGPPEFETSTAFAERTVEGLPLAPSFGAAAHGAASDLGSAMWVGGPSVEHGRRSPKIDLSRARVLVSALLALVIAAGASVLMLRAHPVVSDQNPTVAGSQTHVKRATAKDSKDGTGGAGKAVIASNLSVATGQPALAGGGPLVQEAGAAIVTQGGPNINCRSMADPGWRASCGIVKTEGGKLAWVVERRGGGATCCQTFRVRTFTYLPIARGWVPRLVETGFEGLKLSSVGIQTANLTGYARPELVIGFHFPGSGDTVSYDVVRYAQGSAPKVIRAAWLPAGSSVVVRTGQVDEYLPEYAAGQSVSGPAAYRHLVVRWKGSAIRTVDAGEIQPASVPRSNV